MSEADIYELVKTCLDSMCPLPSNGVRKGKSESYEEQLSQEQLMEASLSSLNKLLQEILVKTFSPAGINSVYQVGSCKMNDSVFACLMAHSSTCRSLLMQHINMYKMARWPYVF